MFRKSKIVLALTLSLALSLSLLAPASLASDTPTDPDPKDAKQAAITKILKVPTGTNSPTGDFEFTVTPVSINGNEDPDATKEMPIIGNDKVVTISYPAKFITEDCECDTECADDVEHYYMQSDDLFSDSTDWPYAGIYVYGIKETRTTVPVIVGHEMTLSKAEYTMKVYVQEKEDESGDLEIFAIAVTKTDDDGGNDLKKGDKAVKVDPKPGDGEETFSKMKFTNTYYKHNGGDGTDPKTESKQTFVVAKTVGGQFSSTSIYFDFTMTVTKNSLVPADTKYRVYILGTNGEPLSASELADKNDIASGSNNYFEFTPGTTPYPLDFKLKHGQRLVFTNAHVGTKYEITEAGAAGYQATATVTTADVPVIYGPGTAEEGLSIPITGVDELDKKDTPKILRVGDTGKNEASFENLTNVEVEAGLNISDLPFYAMLFLALAGLVTFVVVKARSRKNKEDYNV